MEQQLPYSNQKINPPVLVYHESARSIVFRDHVRRQSTRHLLTEKENSRNLNSSTHSIGSTETDDDSTHAIEVSPLPRLQLNKNDIFEPLLESNPEEEELTNEERIAFEKIRKSEAVVKTIKYDNWGPFLKSFSDKTTVYRSSTSLLPKDGKRMRCYGLSNDDYPTGVIFYLPTFSNIQEENAAANDANVWCFPSGYAARTEFNIDSRGNLINGRQEALVSFERIRVLNESFLYANKINLAGREVDSKSINEIPYNEVFVKIGGDLSSLPQRSFQTGIGPPMALFLRNATYNYLVTTLRNRSRMAHVLSIPQYSIPILYINPHDGTRVLSKNLQTLLWHRLASNVNPFQNPKIKHKTTLERTESMAFDQKYQELFDLESEEIMEKLTPEECARIAGGFGATDESVAALLKNAALAQNHHDIANHKDGSSLQQIVNEGLTSALRSGDYHTSRQLLILYSIVAKSTAIEKNALHVTTEKQQGILTNMPKEHVSSPPPPPLDTDRLRSATNSDGLLAVLGAAQVLKAMQDGSAKRKVTEVITALGEWVHMADHNVTFRIKSWNEQRHAQGSLEINTEHNSEFSAFLGTKAISNRKKFITQLKLTTDFVETISFLKAVYDIVKRMHSPCLRLELLQYILGLDNRYSVAHVARSVELAATCMSVEVLHTNDDPNNNK